MIYAVTMSSRPYHHGNLRTVVMDLAEQVLREDGAEAVSLRDLARRAGVTHSAPSKHFADRQALLDALAERGFGRLTAMARAATQDSADYRQAFRDYGACYVRFATRDAALLELMFATKADDSVPAVGRAAEELYATFDDLVDRGHRENYFPKANLNRLRLFFVAIMQGTAALVTAHRITAAQAEVLVGDATALLLGDAQPFVDGASSPPGTPRRGRR
jgi:AcrR family transcriptional regulator